MNVINIADKRVKLMKPENIFSPPKSEINTEPQERSRAFSVFRRAYITFLWGIPVYMFFVLVGTPREMWFQGAMGSLLFSFFAGLIACFIPASRKIIFVCISHAIGIACAFALGMYVGLQA